MIARILSYVSDLRGQTELLETLNWDDELLEAVIDELVVLLRAAPPNVEKALFWLKNTPWDAFAGGSLPPNVFKVIEKNIRSAADKIIKEEDDRKKKLYALPPINPATDDTEWN